MTKTLAFCTDAAVFQQNQILDEILAARYPGALWVTRLAQYAKENEIKTVTGDVALSLIRSGILKPPDVMVLQEDGSSHGFELIRLGAIPLVVTCFESPLYARDFYSRLPEITAIFRNRVLIRGAFDLIPASGINYVLHFPSFGVEAVHEITPWSQRKFMVMIAANKYWKPRRAAVRRLLAWIRDTVRGGKLPVSNTLIEQQLHDKRLSVIEYFGRTGALDLYGPYWGDIGNLPTEWKKRLEGIISSLRPSECSDKREISSGYKFSVCFENVSYPGYVTEKIIDCFKAGVIPIYLGAPDIADFVPRDTFIDFRDFASMDDLDRHLHCITQDIAMGMVNAGQSFLRSNAGREYSYEGFAENVMQMATGDR